MSLGFDKRYILRYLLSIIVCAAVIAVFFFLDKKSSVPILDKDPVSVKVPAGTMFYLNDECTDNCELGKLPRLASAQIMAISRDNHNLLVQTTDNGRRGWVKKDVFKEGTIPQDHPFPGFYDERGHRYSTSLGDIEGKRLEELETEFGTATGIVPEKKGFVATFRMELYNKEDKQTYLDPSIRFADSLATELILPEKQAKKWSWAQYSPLFRLPIWLGYRVTPKQYTGLVTMQDNYHKSIQPFFKFKPQWLRMICNFLLGIAYIAFIFFVFIRIPLYSVYPLPTWLKYNFNLSASSTNAILGLIFFIVYLAFTPFIAMDLSTSLWNVVWTVVLLGGGIYVYNKWSNDIEEKKCSSCNRYNSYDLTEHRYTHSTLEMRSETTTRHETRHGTVDGHSVSVDVPVSTTRHYTVEVKHFEDTYTCRFCGEEIHETSTEEREV